MFKTSLTRLALAGAAAGLLALAGCTATAPTAPVAEAGLLQHLDTTLRRASPERRVALRLTPETVSTGQAITAQLLSGQDGYLYVFQLGTDGKALNMVFPNAIDGANFVAANAALVLPRPGWRMTARGPAGVGYLMAVVAAQPQDLMALTAQLQRGSFEITGPYGAALSPLREVAP